jgi:hypothetical protein
MNAMKGRRVQKIDLSAPADQAPARHGGKKEGLKLKPSNGKIPRHALSISKVPESHMYGSTQMAHVT